MLHGDNQRMLQETNAMTTQTHFMCVIMLSAACALGGPPPVVAKAATRAPRQASPADYAFTVITNMLAVTNGVRLAVTYYQPTPKTPVMGT